MHVQGKHYLRMPVPYCGVWIASRSQTESFMASKQWTRMEDPWEVQ